FVTNLLFGFTVEAKKRVHVDELASLMAERWLKVADTSVTPEALAQKSQAVLAAMAGWMAQQPAVRYAEQSGRIELQEGEDLAGVLTRRIRDRAEVMAHASGQEAGLTLLQAVTPQEGMRGHADAQRLAVDAKAD